MNTKIYARDIETGEIVYRIPGHRHGDGKVDNDLSPVWLLGDASDVDDPAALPLVDTSPDDLAFVSIR